MKKGKYLLRRILLTGVPALLILASCVKEKAIVQRPGSGDDTEIAFSIILPGKSGPASRATTRGLLEIDENNVTDMDILVFKDGFYSYTARCSGSNIVTDGSDSHKKTFTVKLRQGTFDLVLLANARDLTQGTFPGKDKQEVLNALNSEVTGKWPADGSRPIPMWGEKDDVVINESTNLTERNAVKLSRIVAKVDVQIVGTAVNTFELSSVRVYNYNTHGSIAPVPGTWDIDTDPDAPRATVPNVPSGSVLTKGPLLYKGTGVVKTTGCASEIYIFEAENHISGGHTTAKGLLDRTCLVIGGVYDKNDDGNFTNDGAETYYRMDFSTGGSGVAQSFIDVLRNYHYTFSVNKVSGIGHENPDIAFESAPVNIEATVLMWNDGNVGDIYYDGNYYLSFDPGTELKPFHSDADEQTVNITTNFPTGWKIIKITDWNGTIETDITNASNAWLTTDKTPNTNFGTGEVEVPVKVSVRQNTTNPLRTGYIIVKAGTMEVKIKVTQANTLNIRVEIVDPATNVELTQLLFISPIGTKPAEQSFQVNWGYPSVSSLFVNTRTISANAFLTETITPPLGNISIGGTGTITYSVSPPALTAAETDPITGNPFMDKVSRVDFTTTNGISYDSKSIFLQQINYNLLTDVAPDYFVDGQSRTIKVRANFPWIITGVSDPDDILQNEYSLYGKKGGNNTTTGDALSFTMSPGTSDYSKDGKTMTIMIKNLLAEKGWIITITAREDMYLGYFGGELKADGNGEWKHERKLYVQTSDAPARSSWGPETSTGVTNIWDGKGNTFALRADTYQAANRCFTKNANHASINSVDHADYVWYLPAQNQLMAVFGAYTSFARPFGDAHYWSATETTATHSWIVGFSPRFSGYTNTNSKLNFSMVRCVREL